MKNTLLKKTLLLVILSLVLGNVIAQQKDVIHLKNGSVIKGKIIEFIPDQNIKIETADGSIFVFKSSELVKMEKEPAENKEADKSDVQQEVTIEPEKDSSNQSQERRLRTLPKARNNTGEPNSNPGKRTLSRYNSTPDYENIDINDYNTKSALGFAIGGGGLIGALYRNFPSDNFGLEIGAFFRPVYYQIETYYYDYSGYYDYSTESALSASAMFTFSPLLYLNKKINGKGKIKKNGISLKAGMSFFGDINEILGAASWVLDTYKPEKRNKYFSFELGAGAMYMYDKPYGLSSMGYLGSESDISPLIYWKINWFWSL